MSTKIYNAYKKDNVKSVSEFFSFINGPFREELNKTRNYLDAEKVIEESLKNIYYQYFGMSSLKDHEKEDTVASISVSRTIQEQRREIPGTVFHDPHSFSASIGYDEEINSILFLTHHQRINYTKCLEETLLLTDWHYQNQTDRPENISEKEWKSRKESWDRVMPSGLPLETMLEFTLRSNRYWSIDLEDVLSCIKSIENNDDTFFPSEIIYQLWEKLSSQEAIADIAMDYLMRQFSLQKGLEWVLNHANIFRVNKYEEFKSIVKVFKEKAPLVNLEDLNTPVKSEKFNISQEDMQEVNRVVSDNFEKIIEKLENY